MVATGLPLSLPQRYVPSANCVVAQFVETSLEAIIDISRNNRIPENFQVLNRHGGKTVVYHVYHGLRESRVIDLFAVEVFVTVNCILIEMALILDIM